MPQKQHADVPNLNQSWIGFDFDGTLVRHEHPDIGEPVPRMMQRLKKYLDEGKRVKIITARGANPNECDKIQRFLVNLGLPALEVTDRKDYLMEYMYDDRARQVIMNTGVVVGEE